MKPPPRELHPPARPSAARAVPAPGAPPAAPGSAALATPAQVAERWALLTARDIMRRNVVTVSYAASLSEVERILGDHRISGAPVVDEAGRIIGIVSLKDLVERYSEDEPPRRPPARGLRDLASDESFAEEVADEEDGDAFEAAEASEDAEDRAADIMTALVHSVPAEAGLREIARVMVEHGIHRVLVVENERYVGLISTMEILDALTA